MTDYSERQHSDSRIAVLETHVSTIRRDISELKQHQTDQKITIMAKLNTIETYINKQRGFFQASWAWVIASWGAFLLFLENNWDKFWN